MKNARASLALAIAGALLLVSPGTSAWAAVASIGLDAAPVAGAGPVAGASSLSKIQAAALTPLAPAVSAPSAFTPAAAAPGLASVEAGANAAVPSDRGSAQAPATSALEGVRREVPDFSKLSSGDSKGAAASDFLTRVGEFFRPAAASDAPSAAVSGGEAPSAPELARHRASAANSPAVPPVAGAAGAKVVHAFVGAQTVGSLLALPFIVLNMIVHEISHAKVAKWLGDPTAAYQGRASFDPRTWGAHVDSRQSLLWPIIVYLMTGFIFGGAKPMEINSNNFKHPVLYTTLVALAGPASNVAFAALGALAYAGAAAGGLSPIILLALMKFVSISAFLALYNLLPLPPFDGSHVLAAALPALSDQVKGLCNRIYSMGPMGGMLMMGIMILLGFAVAPFAASLTSALISASFTATGVQLASAALPAVAALSMVVGSLKNTAGVPQLAAAPAASAPASPAAGSSVDLIVVFSKEKAIGRDFHLSSVDARSSNFVAAYVGVQRSLLSELNAVGFAPETLAAYDATPIATYRRINAATIKVDATKAAEFEAALRAQGHKVYPNDRRKIVIPRPVAPEDADPSARNPISMAENLKITKADAVHAIALKRFGKPDLNPMQRLKALFGLETPAQPKIAVIDSGADVNHPLLKRVKEVKNMTSGENVDDIGHGSWVTSMVLNYAPWAKNVTHYKTFLNGGANLDDILKSLNTAANDGNLVISNSWGSDDGDPESPDSVLVQKLASEGHVMVFAAGNAGPGANTIGSPAIIQYKDSATGAIRVIAVAAADRNKKVAYFSSRGPGSPKTVGKEGFVHRPDLTALGANTEAAWPAGLGDADRTDPELGALKAIDGTSMSTPSDAGGIALLLIMFGVTEKGAKLDAVVNAMMATLEKTGKNGVDAEGQGFVNWTAAYESLHKTFNPGTVPPTVLERYRVLQSDYQAGRDSLQAPSEVGRGAGYSREDFVSMTIGGLEKTAAELRALKNEYPDIEYHSSSAASRFWMRLSGRGPKA